MQEDGCEKILRVRFSFFKTMKAKDSQLVFSSKLFCTKKMCHLKPSYSWISARGHVIYSDGLTHNRHRYL